MNSLAKYIFVGVGSAATGYAAGYFLAYKKAHKILDKGIAELEAHYIDSIDRIKKDGPYSTPMDAAAILIQKMEDEPLITDPEDILKNYRHKIDDRGNVDLHGSSEDIPEVEPEEVVEPPKFRTIRDPHGPYVISIEEYMEEDVDSPFLKVEMTYFQGDATLVDTKDQIVADIDGVVGLKNLDKWGVGTPDPSQVYIRNERLEIDIEVTKDEQTYSRAILGIMSEDEIARSMLKPKPLKMRDGDDE